MMHQGGERKVKIDQKMRKMFRRRRKVKIDEKMRKMFRRRARDYNSDEEDDDEPLEQAADARDVDGHRKNSDKFEIEFSDDCDEENDGFDGEEGEVSEDESSGIQPGVVRFSGGIKAFRFAFKKIVKKSGGDEDILGPVLSAHKKLIVEKLAEEEAGKKVKGETKKEKQLVNKAQNAQKGLNPSRTKDEKVIKQRRKEAFFSELGKTSTKSIGKIIKVGTSNSSVDGEALAWAPLRDNYMLTNPRLKDWDKMQDTKSADDFGQASDAHSSSDDE